MDNQKGLAPILIVLLIAAVIGGYLVYSGKINLNQKPVAQQTPQPSSTSDETANWKTFINRDAGYSISYPNTWQVDSSNANNLYIFSPNKAKDNQKFYVYIQTEKTDKEPGVWLRGKTIGGVCCPEDARISSPFTIEGKVFYTVLTSQSQYPGIIGQANGQIYYLSTASGFLDGGSYYFDQTDKVLMDNINISDKIMKSIKFIDQNAADTINWKTYTDIKNGYSIKYSNDWNEENPSGTENPISLILKKGMVIINFIIFPTDKKSLNEWLEFTKGKEGSSIDKVTDQTRLTIDTVEAERVIKENPQGSRGQITITMVNTGKVYQIIATFKDNKETVVKDLDQILSTFKFQ